MSRSYKKHGVIKDSSSWTKRYYNGVFRSRNKQRINQGKDPFLMKELVNQYDICDWKSRWNEESKWFQIRPEYWTKERLQKLKRDYFNK